MPAVCIFIFGPTDFSLSLTARQGSSLGVGALALRSEITCSESLVAKTDGHKIYPFPGPISFLASVGADNSSMFRRNIPPASE